MRLLKSAHLPSVYLRPGEVSVCEEPTKVVTVLGSCVSVTLFHRHTRLGAICHGVLPDCRHGKLCGGTCGDMFKYVDCSLLYMLSEFAKRGIQRKEIEVKVFGGADTLASKRENTIGSQNVRIALHIIGLEKMKIAAADVGDSFGRKLIFFSHTGEVFLKRLNNGMGGSKNNGTKS